MTSGGATGAVRQTVAGGASCSAGRPASSLIMSEHFSPIIIVVMHGLIAGRNGRIEPSAIRSPLHSANPQPRVNHRERIGVGTHVRGARRVVDGVVGLVHVVDELVVALRIGTWSQLLAGPVGHRGLARRSSARV